MLLGLATFLTVFRAGGKRGETLVPFRISFLSRRLALRTVRVHDPCRSAGVLDDSSNLKELGRLELLDDVLQFRLLDECR